MDKYQCHITLNNRSTTHLKLDKTDIPWGQFKEGPVADVAPKKEIKAFVAQGTPFAPAGTEGTVSYRFEDDANVLIAIYFDVPSRPFSKNTVTAQSSNPDVVAKVEGFNGEGAVEVCTIYIVDGR